MLWAEAKSSSFFSSTVTIRELRIWQMAGPGLIQDVSAMAQGGFRFSTMKRFSYSLARVSPTMITSHEVAKGSAPEAGPDRPPTIVLGSPLRLLQNTMEKLERSASVSETKLPPPTSRVTAPSLRDRVSILTVPYS